MFLTNSLYKYSKETLREEPHDILIDFMDDLKCGTDNLVPLDFPVPLHEPFKQVNGDPVDGLLTTKNDYRELQRKYRQDYQRCKGDIVKDCYGGQNYLTITKGLLKFYRMKDPDPYFDCDYNVYYTGGFMDCVQVGGRDYLVRPDSSKMLCLTDLNGDFDTIKLPYKASEDVCGLTTSGDDGVLLVRSRFGLTILQISDKDGVKMLWEKRVKLPIIDGKLCGDNLLGKLTVDSRLQIHDVATNKTRRTYNFNNPGGFGQFHFADENEVAVINRKTLFFCDLRCKDYVENPLEVKSCNELCNFLIADGDILLSARHYLLKLDRRNPKESLLHYSHGLRTPPCFLQQSPEGIFLASHQDSDKTCFAPESSLPQLIPNLNDSLRNLQLCRDVLLNPTLKSHLNCSIAGVKLIQGALYFANCYGEIFRQQIGVQQQSLTAENLERWHRWARSVPTPQPRVTATNIEEAGKLFFALDSTANWHDPKPGKSGEFLRDFGAKYDGENAGALAREFLSVWQDDDEEVKIKSDGDLPEELPYFDKVNNWIQDQEFLEGGGLFD